MAVDAAWEMNRTMSCCYVQSKETKPVLYLANLWNPADVRRKPIKTGASRWPAEIHAQVNSAVYLDLRWKSDRHPRCYPAPRLPILNRHEGPRIVETPKTPKEGTIFTDEPRFRLPQPGTSSRNHPGRTLPAMRILITGAGGFVGQILAKALLDDEAGRYHVVLTDIADVPIPKGVKLPQNATVIKADLLDETCRIVDEGLDAAFILHGVMSSGSEENFELGEYYCSWSLFPAPGSYPPYSPRLLTNSR